MCCLLPFPSKLVLPMSLWFPLTWLYVVVASDSRFAFPLTSCVPLLQDSFASVDSYICGLYKCNHVYASYVVDDFFHHNLSRFG